MLALLPMVRALIIVEDSPEISLSILQYCRFTFRNSNENKLWQYIMQKLLLLAVVVHNGIYSSSYTYIVRLLIVSE